MIFDKLEKEALNKLIGFYELAKIVNEIELSEDNTILKQLMQDWKLEEYIPIAYQFDERVNKAIGNILSFKGYENIPTLSKTKILEILNELKTYKKQLEGEKNGKRIQK